MINFKHIQNVLLFVGIVVLIAHSVVTHRYTQATESNNEVSAKLVEALRENNRASLENTKARLELNQTNIKIFELKEKDKK